jgi:hypothetical protein
MRFALEKRPAFDQGWCLPTASALPLKGGTSARPAGSSRIDLHGFTVHAIEADGKGWMAGFVQVFGRRNDGPSRR